MKTTFVSLMVLCCAGMMWAQPYNPRVLWQREGRGDSSVYGYEILALGDQNHDGYNDWAVFAQGSANSTWHGTQSGYIEFFHGGNPPANEPYMIRNLDSTTERSFSYAYTVGDLNGDGFTDWLVEVRLNNGGYDRSLIYFGGPGQHGTPDLNLTTPGFSWYSGIGDFNGDGYDDLYFRDGVNNHAEVFFGGNPMDTIPDWSRETDLGAAHAGNLNGDRFADFESDYTGSYFEIYQGSVSPDTVPFCNWQISHGAATVVNDINRDGYDEISYGLDGYARVLFGGTQMDSIADARFNFPCGIWPTFGGPGRIISAGDFNHDGFNDVVMLVEWCPNSEWGILCMYLGHPWIYSQPAFVIYGWEYPLNLIGIYTAANLGDINGDGVDDLAIGAHDDLAYLGWRGKVVILAGDTSLRAPVANEHPAVADRFNVSVYPNPFNSSTTIELELPQYTKDVSLTIYNLLGQEVFHSQPRISGDRVYFNYDGTSNNNSPLASGLYLLKAATGSFQQIVKLVVMK